MLISSKVIFHVLQPGILSADDTGILYTFSSLTCIHQFRFQLQSKLKGWIECL